MSASVDLAVRRLVGTMKANENRRPLATACRVRYATVSAASVVGGVTFPTIQFAAGPTGPVSIAEVAYLSSYTPTIDDVIAVLQTGSDLLVLGKRITA